MSLLKEVRCFHCRGMVELFHYFDSITDELQLIRHDMSAQVEARDESHHRVNDVMMTYRCPASGASVRLGK